MRKQLFKWLKRTGIALVVLVVIASIPVVRNEVMCVISPTDKSAGVQSIIDRKYHRDEINTYLTYPEWMIVHAYEDFAGVTRQGSESDFRYFKSISRYWSNLCDVSKIASGRGTMSMEYRTMLYVIGLSFTAEFGIKGAYESTLGALTAWVRGSEPTPEDKKIQDISDDYAKFLQQNPWFKYPFMSRLSDFWSQTDWSGGNLQRKIERRISFSMEYAVKSAYGGVIGFGASATMPGQDSLQSVIAISENAPSFGPDVKVVKQTPAGIVIETPRYRAFTEIAKALAKQGQNFTEIAGNDDIMVTVLVNSGKAAPVPGTTLLFKASIQSKPGWERQILDVRVANLTAFIRSLPEGDAQLEHIYDY